MYLGRVQPIQRALGVPPIYMDSSLGSMVVICVTVAMQNLLSFNKERLDVFEVKFEESEKADSHQETNQGHLA